MVKATFPVFGMSCASCAASIENVLQAQEGVNSALVNFSNASVLVEYRPEIVSDTTLKAVLKRAGYDLYVGDNTSEANENVEQKKLSEYLQLKRDCQRSALFTLPVAIIGMFYMNLPYANWIMLAFTLPVLTLYGQRFFINAYKQLKNYKTNMDTLVAVSTGVAFLFSVFNTVFPQYWVSRGLEAHVYYEAAAVIITFILLGRMLEEKAKSSTSTAIKKLIGLQAKTVVRVNADGSQSEVLIKDVVKGDLLLVKPGEKIPVDGVVTEGESFVDESMISGEPVPVRASAGSKVFSGTINQKGSLIFIAEKVGKDTVLSHIIDAVRQAQGSKAPVQRLVDKIASIFVPIVLLLSLITFVSWMLLANEQAFTHALLASITVLVIACPCALGLATPTAIMVGMGKGAENHILIKSAESLEIAHNINAIILDKTGTITEGAPAVLDMIWTEAADPQQHDHLKAVLLALEGQSEHPLAGAVVNYLATEKNSPKKMEQFLSVTGKGVEAVVDKVRYFVGSDALMQANTIEIPSSLSQTVSTFLSQAYTVVYFADNTQLLAVLTIADKVKSGSRNAVAALQGVGVSVYMLTGDNLATASAVASQVGINNFQGGVMPADKADFVRQLQSQGLTVAMVGDGINDSQALAQADISIAMGKGSDIAIDVAQMTLIGSDLSSIPRALELSRRTVSTIRQNLFWAFVYNLIGIPLAAGVLYSYNGFLLNPMIAAAAMALSSVSVVLNSLRLKWLPLSVTDKKLPAPLIVFTTNINCESCVKKIKPLLDAEQYIDFWTVETSSADKVLTVQARVGEGARDARKKVLSVINRAGFDAVDKNA